MTKDEKRLVIMLAQTDMELDMIVAIMSMMEEIPQGFKKLTDYLNNTNEKNSQKIIDKALYYFKSENNVN